MSETVWSARFKKDWTVSYQNEQGEWVIENFHKGQTIQGELVEFGSRNLFRQGDIWFYAELFDSITIPSDRSLPF